MSLQSTYSHAEIDRSLAPSRFDELLASTRENFKKMNELHGILDQQLENFGTETKSEIKNSGKLKERNINKLAHQIINSPKSIYVAAALVVACVSALFFGILPAIFLFISSVGCGLLAEILSRKNIASESSESLV